MNRKLGKVSVKYFLNKKVKPIYNSKKVDTPCYPVCYYVVVKSMTITRSSLIKRFYWGASEKEFEKLLSKGTVFKREKTLIEQIVNKYLNDEIENKVIDFSRCKWYGNSKVAAMNNINAYLDFYLTPISQIAFDVQNCIFALEILNKISPRFHVNISFLAECMGDPNKICINDSANVEINAESKEEYPMFEFDSHKDFKGSDLLEKFISKSEYLSLISRWAIISYL